VERLLRDAFTGRRPDGATPEADGAAPALRDESRSVT
jgi:hypothetical protein